MNKVAIVIHGGAGPDSEEIRKNRHKYEDGLLKAAEVGYKVLMNKGSALDAVEAAVRQLEDDPLFNAGRGSALNSRGEVEMCASIVDGRNRKAGAVALVHHIKNPVSLARAIMTKTNHIYLGGEGAIEYAKEIDVEMEPASYFITENQFDKYAEERKKNTPKAKEAARKELDRYHGTVGAIALDHKGNVAAATSTGGTEFCRKGRIADSSMIGVGAYADNDTCAISCTGDGEYLMRGVIAHSVASLMRYKGWSVAEACHHILHVENKDIKGDIGMIAIDAKGHIATEFNCERMHRAWITSDNESGVKIYKGEKG